MILHGSGVVALKPLASVGSQDGVKARGTVAYDLGVCLLFAFDFERRIYSN